jgi:hypothetical protein
VAENLAGLIDNLEVIVDDARIPHYVLEGSGVGSNPVVLPRAACSSTRASKLIKRSRMAATQPLQAGVHAEWRRARGRLRHVSVKSCTISETMPG